MVLNVDRARKCTIPIWTPPPKVFHLYLCFRVLILTVSTIFLLVFGTILTMWFFSSSFYSFLVLKKGNIPATTGWVKASLKQILLTINNISHKYLILTQIKCHSLSPQGVLMCGSISTPKINIYG